MLRILVLVLALCMGFTMALAQENENFAQRFFDGNENEALYEMVSEQVKAQLSFEDFASTKDKLIAAFGPLQSIAQGQSVPYGDQQVFSQVIELEKQALLMQLVLDQNGLITGLGFTPYQDSATVQEETVSLPEGVIEKEITIGEGEWALPGIVTLLESAENVPLVVLVHGSGPNDKDESIGQTKLFRDLAYTLAQNGIATIRYDKRTLVHGAKMDVKTLTIEEETIEDAILAGKLAAAIPQVDASRIFVLGHSLGGMEAPRIVKEADGLFSGMILAAGTPTSLLEIVSEQNLAAIAKLDADSQASQLEMLDKELTRAEVVFALPVEEMQNETLFIAYPAYYLYEMQSIDPIETIKALEVPTLILQGGGDFQVTVENGLDVYKAGLGEKEYITYFLYPDLNHLFMASIQTQSVQDYDLPLHLDETVAADIIAFINAH